MLLTFMSLLTNPKLKCDTFDATFLRHYVVQARQFVPFLPADLCNSVVEDLCELAPVICHK